MKENSVIKGLRLLREQLSYYTELISPVRPADFGSGIAIAANTTIREVEAHIDVFKQQLPLGFEEVDVLQDEWIEEVDRYSTQFGEMKNSEGKSLSIVFLELANSLKQLCDYLNNPGENNLLSFFNGILEDYRSSHAGIKLQREYLKWKHTLPQGRMLAELKLRVNQEINLLETHVLGCHVENLFDVEQMMISTEGMARFIYYNPQKFKECNNELSHLLQFALLMEWLSEDIAICKQTVTENMSINEEDIISQLKPIFFGSEEEAKVFLVSIQGMKPTQITDKVNKLVGEKKISELSKHRDLWKVLNDCGIYERSESNWNMQVK